MPNNILRAVRWNTAYICYTENVAKAINIENMEQGFGYSQEQLSNTGSRALNDAELVKDGASYENGPHGEPILSVDPDQIDAAREEMNNSISEQRNALSAELNAARQELSETQEALRLVNLENQRLQGVLGQISALTSAEPGIAQPGQRRPAEMMIALSDPEDIRTFKAFLAENGGRVMDQLPPEMEEVRERIHPDDLGKMIQERNE